MFPLTENCLSPVKHLLRFSEDENAVLYDVSKMRNVFYYYYQYCCCQMPIVRHTELCVQNAENCDESAGLNVFESAEAEPREEGIHVTIHRTDVSIDIRGSDSGGNSILDSTTACPGPLE